MAETLEEQKAREAKEFAEMTPVNEEPEKYDPAADLDASIGSRLTTHRLAGLAEKFARQLAEARREHIVKIDTIATQALDASKEYINELELQNEKMNAALRRLRSAMETGSIVDLIDTISRLQQEKAALAHQVLDLNAKLKAQK